MRPLTPRVMRGTLGTLAGLAILVACSSDHTESAVAPTPDAAPAFDATTSDAARAPDVIEAPTALVVGTEVDPYAIADEWQIDVTTVDGQSLASDRQTAPLRELRVAAPTRLDAPVTITLTGHTHIDGQADAIVGPRVATAAFVPGHVKLAYLYLDSFCAYDQASIACAADESCSDGACRPRALGDLPDWTANWRDDPPSPCSPDAPPSLVFGDGNLAFTPKNDGDTMTMNCGTQGGHHIWLGLQMRGLPQGGVDVHVTSDAPDDGGITPYPTDLISRFTASSTAGTCQLLNLQFQLDTMRPYTDYLGHALDITVTAQKPDDPKQRKATITRRVTISPTLDPTSCGG